MKIKKIFNSKNKKCRTIFIKLISYKFLGRQVGAQNHNS